MKPTTNEIENEMYMAADWASAGKTAYHSMTYEQGVEAALSWVLGQIDEKPIEEKFVD